MAIPLPNQISLADRHRLLEKRTVPSSTEPYRLFVKRNGVFIRSFESEEKRESFIETAPDSVFSVKTQPPRRRSW